MSDPYYSPGDPMTKAIEDIKSINRLLDPVGQAWADDAKRRREERSKQFADLVFDTAVRILREHARRVESDRQAGKV